MKYYKLFLVLTLGALFSLVACKDEEPLDLQTYPENEPSISISDTEGGSELILNATYNSEGKIEVSEELTRTYTFNFKASPENINLSYEILSKNIPSELISLSTTKSTVKPGYTTASVTVSLKDEDFSFAQKNIDEEVYELGVRALISGYKTPVDPVDSKVIIKKEAYIPRFSIVGEEGSKTSFERAYSQGQIVNPDPISYSFKIELDKPAIKETKIKFSTLGLDEKFQNTVSLSPNEITIPVDGKTSGVITWSIKDDFLLQTTEEESHVLTISPVSEDASADKKNGVAILSIAKVFRNFEYVAQKNTDWVDLSKTGWAGELLSAASGRVSSLIDGNGGTGGNDLYTSNTNLSFIIDMASPQKFSAIGVDYYRNSGSASSPKKMKISTSSDKENWTSQGEIDTPQSFNHYFNFFSPVNARYVKFELSGKYNNYLDLTEIYIFTK